MATKDSESFKDVQTCTICLEIFKNPKYLPCLHTFCETCIVTYISSRLEKESYNSITCPICRGPVRIPEDKRLLNDWIKSLPLNILVTSLIEKREFPTSDKTCMICKRMSGETLSKAEYVCIECGDTLCESCEKCHRSIRLTSKHSVKSIGDLTMPELPLKVIKNYDCEKHEGKALELYCADHEVPCCCICVSVTHRKCERVLALVDISKDIASSKSVTELKQKLNDSLDDVISVTTNQNASLETFMTQYQDEFKKIGDVFEHLRKTINAQENMRKAELLKKFNEAQNRIETTLVVFENKKKAIENIQKLLKIGVNNASEVDLMIEMIKLKRETDKIVNGIKDNSFDLVQFELMLKNTDTNIPTKAIEQTCSVHFENNICSLDLKSCADFAMYKFNRFSDIGNRTESWHFRSNTSAISFTVSEKLALFGFVSYGPKNQRKSRLEAKLIKDDETLSSVKISLEDQIYENDITEVHFENPVKIVANMRYDVVFTIANVGSCNYGINGMSDIECEGVRIKFTETVLDDSRTDTTIGQIPGFVFCKL